MSVSARWQCAVGFVVATSCALAQAQTDTESWQLQGQVLERGTRRALAAVTVFVPDHEDYRAVTDERGEFSIAVDGPGNYPVSAIAVGFETAKPRQVSLSDAKPQARLTLYLEPALQLPEVLVYGERNPDRVSKLSISGKELQSVAGSAGDPMRGLQSLPGVAIANDGSAAPAVRGSAPDDNLYFVDDQPVGYLFHFGGVFSILNADLVKDFNFYPSAFGAQYGDALGGVIDVSLRNPRTDRFGAKLNVNFYEADFLLEGPINERQSWLFAARRSYYDLILPKTGTLDEDEGIEYREFPRFQDYQGKYVWHVDDENTLRLQIIGAADSSELFVPDDSSIAEHDPVLVGKFQNDIRFDGQALIWTGQLSPETQHKMNFNHLVTTADNVVGAAGTVFVKFDRYELGEELSTQVTKAHALSLGARYAYTGVDFNVDARNAHCTEFDPDCDLTSAPQAQSRDSLQASQQTLYAKDRWRPVEPLALTLGLRWTREDYLEESFLEPRLGAEWQVAERTLLTAGWGKYHQFPDGGQVIDEFGNPNLSHLRARHAVLGALQRFDDRWSWSTEFFYKWLDDLVVADPVENYSNGGSGRAYGVDMLLKKELTERFSGWVSLTLSRSERTHEETGETFPSNFEQPLVTHWVGSYKLNRAWTLAATWHYHSGNAYTPIVGSTLRPGSTDSYLPVYGDTNSRRLPDYHRLDLRLGKDFRFNTWKLNTYFELINAYNRKNVGGYRYNNDFSEREPVYQLPLIFSFGVQAEF